MKKTSLRTQYGNEFDDGLNAASFCNMGGGDPPPAPDYTGAANATAAGNLAAAKYATQANRVNQTNPWGNLSYTNNQSFDTGAYGKAMADWQAAGSDPAKLPQQNDYNVDNWTQTQTLTPELQKALTSQLAVQQGKSDVAGGMMDTVKNSYADTFDAPSLSSYTSGVPGVNTNSVGSAGTFSSGANQNTSEIGAPSLNSQYAGYTSTTPGLNTNQLSASGSYLNGVQGLNQNAPQFNQNNADLYAKNAYDAQWALMQPGVDQQTQRLQNGLALQGLNPGSEASGNAQGSYFNSLAAQKNALAASSYLSGAQTAQGNYASELAGYNSSNAARTQELQNRLGVFNADITGQNTANAARNTQEGNSLAAYQANQGAQTASNTALNQQLANALAARNSSNLAQAAQYGQDQSAYSTNLAGLQTNQGLQTAQNQAQQQAYNQAVQNYGMDYQSALTARNQPLNEMNALLTGAQVQQPNFSSYALQGQTQGADLLGAATGQGTYNQGIYNADQARQAGNMSAMAGLVGAGATAYGLSSLAAAAPAAALF
jgi:hypothetical protein